MITYNRGVGKPGPSGFCALASGPHRTMANPMTRANVFLYADEFRAEAQRSRQEAKRKALWQGTWDPFVKVHFRDGGASHDGPLHGVIRWVW